MQTRRRASSATRFRSRSARIGSQGDPPCGSLRFRRTQLTFETVPLELHAESDTVIAVRALRTQRWRVTGEIAAEETLHARFTFDGDGAISSIVLG